MKYLYLIYENANREMIGKILLTTKALNYGWKVVIGQKNFLRQRLKFLPKGIIIEKGMRKGMNKFTTEWKKNGHIVCMSDEEAITYVDDKNYFLRNIDKNISKSVDFFLSIGPRHFNTLNKIISKKKIIKIGNVKYDLYKKKNRDIFFKKSKKIKKLNNNFILITSRFGNINQHLGRQIKTIKNQNYQKTSKELFYKFLNLPNKLLSKQKKFYKIIIRPHPSENFKTWEKQIKNLKHAQVIYKDNVAEWILASNILIQNRCTTGLEAFLLDKKVISYGNDNSNDKISKIFKSISLYTNSEEDFSNKFFLKKKITNKGQLDKILYNYKSNQTDASDVFVNFINKIYKYNRIKLDVNKSLKTEFIKKNFLPLIKSYLVKNSYNEYLVQKNGDTNLNNYVMYFDYLVKKNNFKYKYKINEISNEIYLVETI